MAGKCGHSAERACQNSPSGFDVITHKQSRSRRMAGAFPEIACSDQWRCRFMIKAAEKKPDAAHLFVTELLKSLVESKLDFTHTENLYTFDGSAGYTLAPHEQ